MNDPCAMNLIPYPYMAYSDKVRIRPLFKGLTGGPLVVNLSPGSSLFDLVDIHDQQAFQKLLDEWMKDRHTFGLASYLENRETILSRYPQMKKEKRFFHLGLDIIVALGTPLFAPLDGTVAVSGYEAGDKNYGAHVLLKHESPYFETFYSFYGHLNREKLPAAGQAFTAGEPFAYIGDFHENGNWFYHTHLQIITQKGIDKGYLSKGYCAANDLAEINDLCPSPLPFFKIR
ncbi:MAG: peptidoglycan DD-metalloendopeptidase family protein [Desulfobacula sp.]|jgi:hypothetical protein